jgi:hypothetical protein
MARKKKVVEALPTIWRVDDVLWEQVQQVLKELDPPARFGPDRIDQRQAFNGLQRRSLRCHRPRVWLPAARAADR